MKMITGVIVGAALALGLVFLSGGRQLKIEIETGAVEVARTGEIVTDEFADIDALMSSAWPDDGPGASIIVRRDGDIVLKKGYGLADIEHSVPVRPETVFRLGSITKQFTSVAILMLEQDGLLKTSDNINKHFPDYPTHGEIITVHHLLTHTSGILNYTSLRGTFAKLAGTNMRPMEVLDLVKDRDLRFKPGTRWEYSNSGYLLLGALIEKLSGKSYAQFIDERIFTPLEMTSSHYGSNALIPHRARGYTVRDGVASHAPYLSMTIPHAAGALLSSVEDMDKWTAALHEGRVLPLEVLERAWENGVLENGEKTGYGYGWLIGTHAGLKVIGHDGGIPGFSSYAISMPDVGVYVALLTNNQNTGPHLQLAHSAAALASGKPIPDKSDAVTLPEETLQKFTGTYRLKRFGTRKLTLVDGQLWSQRGRRKNRIYMTSETTFVFSASTTTGRFELATDGSVTAMFTKPWARPEGRAQKE